MKNKRECKVFIVEGTVRECEIIKKIKEIFFKHKQFEIITLPAGQNIYMLWQKMEADHFQTDLIEVLRESDEKIRSVLEEYSRNDFSEVYLFFDYDVHQQNLSKEHNENSNDVIVKMLQSFDNETENGKLYISYPMVEALRDFNDRDVQNKEEWFYNTSDNSKYKDFSARRGKNLDIREYSFEIWRLIIGEFIKKVSLLYGSEEFSIAYKDYKDNISPKFIYGKEKEFEDKVLIISAFPEFLLDYFSETLWKKCLHKS